MSRKLDSAAHHSTVRILAVVVVAIMLFSTITLYLVLNQDHRHLACDSQLSDQIGTSEFCLQNFSVNSSNTNATYLPVLIMQSGTNATVSVLYHNILTSTIQSVTAKPQLPPLTSSTTPYALTLDTGIINTTMVDFSQGKLVYENRSWSMYNYTVSASNGANGYYAILPPFYFGFYPALVVESNTHTPVNKTNLAMWGYTGRISSLEYILPATIVATTNMRVINVSISSISYCPNVACTIVSHSGT